MLQSGLLRCSLIIALGTIGICAGNEDVEGGVGGSVELPSTSSPRTVQQVPRDGEPPLWNTFEHVVFKKDDTIEELVIERIPDLTTNTSPKERAAPALTTPRPTPPPQKHKRQDDGQVQALSDQLRSLSQSATQAISSVSSSASSAISLVSQSARSVRQSADQAVQSANQNADNANRQLSQTQSSASSALSAASAQASDDLQRSLSSMSSRISSLSASAQSSAASAISAARAEASSSAANALNIAASQIQEAEANASGVRGDASSIVTQVQSNSVSGTNVAIIVTVSVVGTAILTAIGSYFIVRYRRKKRRDREGIATPVINTSNEKQYEKPIAVRGTTPGSPRFTPFGGGTGYPMDKFKLPDLTLSPFLRKKTNEDGRSSIGFARSGYNSPMSGGPGSDADVYGVSPTSFRLQKKDNSIRSATSVRLIRVGSNTKGKAKAQEEDQKALLSPILSPAPPLPAQTPAPPAQPEQIVIPQFPSPPQTPASQPQPQLQPPPQIQRRPVEPPSPAPDAPPIAAPTPTATRASRASLASEPPNPVRRTATMASTQSRLRFRDSSDVESAEPSPMPEDRTATTTSMRNTNTASLRSTGTTPSGRPKNAGPASFATFPRIRDSPPRGSAAEAILNRSRGLSGVAVKLREEEEERRRRDGGSVAETGTEAGAGDTASKGPNWPFGSG